MQDEATVSKEQWVEATDFFNSLVIVSDCLENNLCLEFAGPIKQVFYLPSAGPRGKSPCTMAEGPIHKGVQAHVCIM